MWVNVSPERFLDLQPMLEFANPEAEKQKKLVQAGIVRWAGHVEPMVKLWSYGYGHERRVPMGAGLSHFVASAGPDEHIRQRLSDIPWLMEHQRRAVYQLAKHHSGVVVAPCGGGKTQIGIGLHEVLGEDKPTLVVVHTQDLALQWAGRLKQCVPTGNVFHGFGTDRFRAALEAALYLPHSLLVATVQTLAEMGPHLRTARFATIIVDEAHHTPAKTFRDVLENVTADRVYGLTATPERDDGWTPAMFAWLGPTRYEVTADYLCRIGLTVSPKVMEVRTPFFSASGDFSAIVEDLCGLEERNALIARMVAKHGDFPQLVLTSRVDHAEALARLIPDAVAVVGKSKKREQVFADVRAGHVKVLVATQLADEGLDLPSLTAVHMTAPSRAAGRVIPRAGRVMRSAPGKGRPVVYDYVDDMGLLVSQWRSRMSAYNRFLSQVEFGRIDARRGEA
jgi:superfamily II DNA or RNA helicase